MRFGLLLGTAVTAVSLAFGAAATTSSPSSHLAVAGRSNTNPTVAASGLWTVVAWGATAPDGPTDIYLSVSRDAGQTFGAPTRVSDAGSRANLSGEQPPRIAFVTRRGGDPAIVVVWTSHAVDGTRLVSARSNDGGKTFSRPAVVRGSVAAGNRGWESIAFDRGRVVALWLDHRDAAMTGGAHDHMEHQPGAHAEMPAHGVETAQLSKLFFGRLDAADARPITAGVCYCCKTALAAGPDGALYAAWRHVYPGNLRDIAFAMSRDGGRTFSTPLRVSEDRWELDGCPENGPALAVDLSSRIHVVWPTLVKESGRETLALFYAMSRDGRSFRPRVRIPTAAAAYHAQILALHSDGLMVAWDEAAKGGHEVRFARGTPGADGRATFAAVSDRSGLRGSYPSIAETPRGVIAAWTDTTGTAARIAVLRVQR
jgi:hypothetical protein